MNKFLFGKPHSLNEEGILHKLKFNKESPDIQVIVKQISIDEQILDKTIINENI